MDQIQKDTAPVETLTPVNDHIVRRVRSFTKELPTLLEPIATERDFLLKEVFPPAMTALNAFADAGEVLSSSLEGYDITPLAPTYESYVMDAVRAKILCRIIPQFNLSSVETQYFLTRVLAAEGHSNDRIQTILHEVQSLVDVQRQSEGAKAQMRPVPATKINRERRGVRLSGRGTKGGDRSVQSVEDIETHRALKQSRSRPPRAKGRQKVQAPSQDIGRDKFPGDTGL